MSNPEKNQSENDKNNRTTAIGEFPSIEEFCKNGLVTITNTIQTVNTLPAGSSRDAYCAYPSFGKIIDEQSKRIIGIIAKVIQKQNIKGNITRRQEDEQFEMLLECNDVMLENINSNLDELAGIKKTPQTILVESNISTIPNTNSGSWNNKINVSKMNSPARLITAQNIARPQVNFKTPIDNSPNTVFEPRIKDKPYSLKPLAILPEYDEDGNIESFLHPYEFELDKFEPSINMLNSQIPNIFPKPVADTELVYVDNESMLKQTLEDLKKCSEFSVDLEHHSYRSFQGITCLMQISTSEKDYIIDTLALREEMQIFNEIFANPKILKIFHGAESDIDWLQRDLSLYIVNMFDTHQAAKLLGLPRLSLGYLLKTYCGIESDKTLQLADWRIRPLPEELIKYAREDTHFLIYIYKILHKELLLKANNQTNLLKNVYQKSTEICKKLYIKPKIHANSHIEMYRKYKRNFDNRQMFALEEIFLWRDQQARKEDESYGYVLPNHMMLQIAESLPREMQGILACCNPIPPLVRQNLNAIHQIILKAREQPLVKKINNEEIMNRVVLPFNKDYSSKLLCSHDFSNDPEFRDDLPTLLGPVFETEKKISDVSLAKPILDIFDISTPIGDEAALEKLLKLKTQKFISPYERYKAIIPFAEKEKLDAVEQKKLENIEKLLCPIKNETTDEEKIASNLKDIPCLTTLKDNLNKKRKTVNGTSSEVETKRTKIEECNDKAHLSFTPKLSKQLVKDPLKEENITFHINVKDCTVIKETSVPEAQSNQCEPSTSHSSPSSKNRQNNLPKKKFKSVKSKQSSNQPVHFDYKNLDYKKYSGGAQKAKSMELQAKYHGKGKPNKANQKKFNKLFTFTNNKKK